jgi:hypothetical protein
MLSHDGWALVSRKMGVEKGSLVTVGPFTTAYVFHSKGVESGIPGPPT